MQNEFRKKLNLKLWNKKSLSPDQILAGVEIPLPALISKLLIFVVLGGVAVDLERKMYKN